jgi:O-antigen/teichoic acid export membrane protein
MLKIILAIGGLQVVSILIGIVRSKVVALLLGPEGVGVVSVIDQIVQLVAYVSAFSLPMAAVRFLSRAHSEGEERFRQVYAAFLRGILGLTAFGTLIAAALIAGRPGWLGSEVEHFRGYLLIAVLAVPGMVLSGFVPNVLAAAQRTRTSAALGIVTNASLATAAIAGILVGGVGGMYLASVGTLALLVFGELNFLRVTLRLPLLDSSASLHRELSANRGVIAFSAIFSAGAVASSVALLVMRQSVLGSSGEAAAGLLQSAYALGLAINMVLGPTNGLYLTPTMNRNIPETEKLNTALQYQTNLAAILVLVSIPLIVFPKTALWILFSGRFVAAGEWVFLFVLAQVVLQLAGIYQAVLIGTNRLAAFAVVTVGGHLVVTVTAALLAPSMGIAGAGAALLAGAVFTAIGGLVALRAQLAKLLKLSRFALPAYAVTACALLGATARMYPEWTPAAFALRLGACVVTIAAGALFASREDRAAVMAILRRLASRVPRPLA